jgi:syntaxin 5
MLAVAKKRTLFDDRPQEIQELTYIIREDITNLNKQIAHLQGFMKKQQNQQQNTKAHSANVVVALQSKLANMSSEFKQVLEVRTEVHAFPSLKNNLDFII